LISDKLNDLIQEKSQQTPTFGNEIDKNLYRIREELKKLKTEDYQDVNPFWHSTILPFWDDSTEKLDKEQLSDKTLMEYKKAMILYGPPGTSKSYQARKMAEGMIAEALRKTLKISAKRFLVCKILLIAIFMSFRCTPTIPTTISL
jgi:5-methylcytosine-specific restriction protein B